VQLACPVVVEYLTEHAGMPIKKVLAHKRIIVCERLRESGQSSSGNLLEGGLKLILIQRICLSVPGP